MSFHRSPGVRTRLRPEEFRLLRDLINEHAGLVFDDSALYSFERRLGERLSALDLPGFMDYYKHLRFSVRGAAELDEAIDVLTTKETYFFRQDYQLRAFEQEIIPRFVRDNPERRRITLWSAGCSTGEEAYTLAIITREHPALADYDVRIIGTDISKSNVATARRGVYRESSFRTTAPEIRSRYFDRTHDGFRVREDLQQNTHFGQVNLLDAHKAAIVGRVDIVFCRNVLIYFDVGSRRRVIDNLYQRLLPGGYLLLGHSESLINVSTAFELVHLKEDLVYRKPVAAGLEPGQP
ncbi:MAG: protein-glutamate O-methyltransferase CheR [Polyangiaceae bacterium]